MPDQPLELTPAVVARLQDLLRLPLDEALYHLAREAPPFRVGALAWLLRRGLLLGPYRPKEVGAAARLALAIAEQFPITGLSFETVSDARALARALLAETRLREKKLEAADLELREAERHLGRGWGDLKSRAYVLAVRAMVARADAQGDKALDLFEQAALLFASAGEGVHAAAARLRRGILLERLGEDHRAKPLLLSGLLDIDPAAFRPLALEALDALVRIFRAGPQLPSSSFNPA